MSRFPRPASPAPRATTSAQKPKGRTTTKQHGPSRLTKEYAMSEYERQVHADAATLAAHLAEQVDAGTLGGAR